MAYTHQKSYPIATLSDNLSHGPCGIWANLQLVIKHMKQLHPGITRLHMISDGPTTQYRCKTNFYMFATNVFDYEFTEGGTWNFMEAGHGKGAPDGIGAEIKRTADTLVNTQGRDITRSADLIDGIRKVGSTIQLFEISADDVAEHERRMPAPADIPGIPETMKLHQVVVRRKGVVSSRILSCFCADDCLCFSPITTTVQDQTGGSTNNDLSSGIEITHSDVVRPCKAAQRKNIKEVNALREVEDVNEALINRYIVVEYDGLPYPGVVIDVDDNSVEVSAMHRIGVNRFFWPLTEDRFTYEKDEIVTILEGEPELVTKRHRKLDDVVWQQICTKMSLDEQGKKHL